MRYDARSRKVPDADIRQARPPSLESGLRAKRTGRASSRSRIPSRRPCRCWVAALSRACRSARCNCRSAVHPSTSCRGAPFRSEASRRETPPVASVDRAACPEQTLKRQIRPQAAMQAVLGRRNPSMARSWAVPGYVSTVAPWQLQKPSNDLMVAPRSQRAAVFTRRVGVVDYDRSLE